MRSVAHRRALRGSALGRPTVGRPALAAILVALALFASAAASAAPARALPASFWGASPQGELTQGQLERLRRGGVDAIRFPVDWTAMQPSPRRPIDWSGFDLRVAALARAGIEPLPFLYGAPRWAVRPAAVPGTGGAVKAPGHLPVGGRAGRGWAEFARGAVERYGPRGKFWSESPQLPKRPIRTWQVWNEPNFKYFVARPNPVEYGRLVKLTAAAIRSRDRGATIVLGGLFARPSEAAIPHRPPWAYTATDFLDRMYRGNPGIAGKFDGVALHPYTTTYLNLPSEIEEVRRTMAAHRDAAKGLWLTELGWSSESPRRSDAFAVGVRGQAAQLNGAFRLLRANQGRWRLHQVDWFSVDDLPGACNFCGGSGLFRKGFRPKPAWRAYVRFAGGRP